MLVEALLLACALTSVISAPESRAVSDNADEGLNGTIPRYVQSLELFMREQNVLREFLHHEPLPITDPRRHQILVAGVLVGVVEYLNSDCTPPDYEHEFLPAVDILLPLVWQDHSTATAKLEGYINDTIDIIHKIEEIVDLYCVGLDQTICNRVLQDFSNKTDDFDGALELLVLVGELAELHEEFRHAAGNSNAVDILLNGQEKLKPLVFKAAEVYDMLYGKQCEP